MVLHAGVAHRRGLHEVGDLARRGVGADADGAQGQLAFADHRRRERRRALAARDRKAFAGDGLLVDGGETFDDLAVDRDHLAGIDDDEIAHCELRRGDRGDLAVTQDPGAFRAEFQQSADGAPRTGRRQVADPVAELDQPGDQRAGQRIGLHDRGGDRQHIEEIDIEAALIAPDPPCPPRDRNGVPQHQRHVHRDHERVGAERHRKRQRRQAERRTRGEQAGHVALGRPRRRLCRGSAREQVAAPPGLPLRPASRRQSSAASSLAGRRPQPGEDALKHRLMGAVEFDHEARTGGVEARAGDAGLRPQPSERGFRERRLAAKLRHMQAHPARQVVEDRDIHLGALNWSIRPGRPRPRVRALGQFGLHLDEMVQAEQGERHPYGRSGGGADLENHEADEADAEHHFQIHACCPWRS